MVHVSCLRSTVGLCDIFDRTVNRCCGLSIYPNVISTNLFLLGRWLGKDSVGSTNATLHDG